MPRDPQVAVFIGINGSVIALDARTGSGLWIADLRSNEYVTVMFDGEALFAANSGEVWRLDPKTGDIIWHEELKGFGRGLVSLASSRSSTVTPDATAAEEQRRRDAQAAAAAAAT